MTEVQIRGVTLRDVPEILQHRRAMFEDMGSGDAATLSAMESASRSYLEEVLQQGSYRGWFAVAPSEQVAGGIGVLLQSWPPRPWETQAARAYLLNMYVYPAYRRQGIARRLLQVSVDWCREQGFATVSLHASQFGRPLYESMGFEQTNEMRLKLK